MTYRPQMPPLASSICDVCGKPRSFGTNTYKHTKCSKIRQARYAAERAESKIKRAGQPAGEGV